MADLNTAQRERLIQLLVEHYKTVTFDDSCLTEMIIRGLPKNFTPLHEYTDFGLVKLYEEEVDSNVDEDFLKELNDQINK